MLGLAAVLLLQMLLADGGEVDWSRWNFFVVFASRPIDGACMYSSSKQYCQVLLHSACIVSETTIV
jgi:hypothetical protein